MNRIYELTLEAENDLIGIWHSDDSFLAQHLCTTNDLRLRCLLHTAKIVIA